MNDSRAPIVLENTYARTLPALAVAWTAEPAPDPRPGPTGTLFCLAQLMKSATIKK